MSGPNTEQSPTRRGMLRLPYVIAAVLVLVLGAGAGDLWAQDGDVFSEAEILVELNHTDGDAGIQVFLDGDAWKEVKIIGPDSKNIFEVKGKGNLKKLGLTEEFFESEEPAFGEDIDSLAEFLEIFPAGDYMFEGKTAEGGKLTGMAELTHIIPCAPEVISPVEDSEINPATTFVVVAWEPVTGTLNHETLECEEGDVEITGYQVIVEQEEPTLRVFSADLPASATSITVSPEFLLADLDPDEPTEFKIEVIATEESGNRTITELLFFGHTPSP